MILNLLHPPIIHGRGIGKTMGTPTINFDHVQIKNIPYGVYAGIVVINGERYHAAIHYGPRPTHGAEVSLEVHVLHKNLTTEPKIIDELQFIEKIRDIRKFENEKMLKDQIQNDLQRIHVILASQ